jgi:hypothetical protein
VTLADILAQVARQKGEGCRSADRLQLRATYEAPDSAVLLASGEGVLRLRFAAIASARLLSKARLGFLGSKLRDQCGGLKL